MSTSFSLKASAVLSVLLASIFLMTLHTPFTFAQSTAASGNDLRTAVQTLLLADPRAASLPQKEFDAMVNALVSAAEKKGLSARDISWRPQPVESFAQSASVQETQSCNLITCMINEAFGFTGPDMSIPIWFGISSAILVLLIGGMIEIHRRKHLVPTIKKDLQK